MKANDYLKLTERMMTAQADYYATSKKFGSKSQEAIAALIKSKDLEKQVWAVIKGGSLEPDEPTATVHVYTTEEYQRQLELIETTAASADEERRLRLHLEDERDAGEVERVDDLDLSEE